MNGGTILSCYNCATKVKSLHVYIVVSFIFYLRYIFLQCIQFILSFFSLFSFMLMCMYESDHAARPPHDV